MNFSEAIAIYLATPTAENIVLGELKLITDRGTKRIYKSDGNQWVPNLDEMASEEWTVILNQ
jgi:hypothetical protein